MAESDRHDPAVVSTAETTAEDAEVFVLGSEGVPEDAMSLALGDLLPDASGEVVLFADDQLPVNILTHETVTDAGIADSHVTATGVDVTGLHFYSFESGITLYSPSDLLILPDGGTA